MTPLQLATTHCANYQDGQCIGMDFDAQGNHKSFRSKDQCWLAEPIRKCPYFEECVMPMGRSDWPKLKTPKEHELFEAGVRLYRRATLLIDPRQRICPQCEKRPLEPRKQLCYVCRQAVKAEKRRQRNLRYRASGVDETPTAPTDT